MSPTTTWILYSLLGYLSGVVFICLCILVWGWFWPIKERRGRKVD